VRHSAPLFIKENERCADGAKFIQGASEGARSRLAGGIAVLMLFAAIPLLAGWLHSSGHSAPAATSPAFAVRTAEASAGWSVTVTEPTDRERALLQFSEGIRVNVRTPSGISAQVLHFFWKPGSTMPLFAWQHSPELCLPATGWIPTGARENRTLTLHGRDVDCVLWRFEQDGSQLVVIQALLSNGIAVPARTVGGSRSRFHRLQQLWSARKAALLNEELLIYMPALSSRRLQQQTAASIFQEIFAPLQ
jgi:hypothetical protein